MFFIKTAESRYTLGIAYPHDEVDAHGETMRPDQLEAAAWTAMRKGVRIGINHEKGTDGAGEVVESYVYRGPDWTIGDTVVKAGDWLVGTVWQPAVWDRIKKGELTGYSMQGWASRKSVTKDEVGDDKPAAQNIEGIVAMMRALLERIDPSHREHVLRLLAGKPTPEDHKEVADRTVERLEIGKSQPGSFTDLVGQTQREFQQSFAESLKTDEKPVEIFSKERLAEERAERVAKDDDDVSSMTHSCWHREPARPKGPRISHHGR